ncbi:unnamed protein product [Schistosoma mattheei]|uniref:Uncharacterized protein n=1 Tax=Schistosoma mattheei TaxID=31246 RepID=A0A183Q4G2_9TREM|nr:unnamed protein product [Schistosoma mattheei]
MCRFRFEISLKEFQRLRCNEFSFLQLVSSLLLPSLFLIAFSWDFFKTSLFIFSRAKDLISDLSDIPALIDLIVLDEDFSCEATSKIFLCF